MRILLTGSSGFIGGNAMDALLEQGIAVRGVDILPPRAPHHQPHCSRLDILDLAALRAVMDEFAPTEVLHLAAQTNWDRHTDPKKYYAPNVEGVANLVAAIRATPSVRRAVFTSSQLVCHVNHRPAHDVDYAPTTIYGESKVETEKIVRASDGGGVEWCIVRPTTIWGPGMKPHYQRFLNMVRRGLYVHVGKSPLFKSYGYVGNTVHQYLQVLRADADRVHGRVFYVADYEPMSLRAWTDAIQVAFGARKVPTVPEFAARALARVGDCVNAVGFGGFPFNTFRLTNVLTPYVFDLGPIQEVCGPLPYTMDDGVRRMVDWMLALNAKQAADAKLHARTAAASNRG
jgi:nucleoside-diphosphate-sugar epimerase